MGCRVISGDNDGSPLAPYWLAGSLSLFTAILVQSGGTLGHFRPGGFDITHNNVGWAEKSQRYTPSLTYYFFSSLSHLLVQKVSLNLTSGITRVESQWIHTQSRGGEGVGAQKGCP